MRASLQFLVLGPLEVRAADARLPLGGRKQRALLAILLLHANEVVSSDRLLDMLWGESPPDTATTALHGYVSQLRKILEPDRAPGAAARVLVTHEPGYVLRVEPDQLDLERFTTLVSAAREALAAARADEASALLQTALGLWRGRALEDLEGEAFAQAQLARLAELRVAAEEERFEAELALGRHHALIAELESHTARHPLRERPRGQLMLALYRAGRQAEALRVFQDARRTLVDEVGIEPGTALRDLQRAILEQDPALDPPGGARSTAASPPSRSRLPRRRTRRLAAAGAVAVAVAVAGAVAFSGRQSASGVPVRVPAGSVAIIDPGSNRVVGAVRTGGTPTSVSAGEGAVWVLDADRQVVSRVDPATRAVRTFGTGSVPTDLAAGAGALWVANGRKSRAQFVGPLATTVSSIDPESSAIRATVALPRRTGVTSNVSANHIALTPEAVWVVNPDFSVSRIDPRDSRITRTITGVSAVAVAAGDRSVWVLNDDDSLTRVDRRRPSAPVRIASNGLSGLAVGAGAVWATAPYDGLLWRIDPEPRLVQRTIAVGEGASFVAVGDGAVWVVNALRGTVSRIDPASNRVVATIDLGGTPRSAAVSAGKLWVTVGGADAVPAARSSASANAHALPADTCGRVVYGGAGSPDRLIVSDLPLRGGPGLATRQMAQAITFILRERGFRAGGLRIGYQSCDDSTTQTGIFDRAKCASNAKAYAANRSVIGVIGPYNSGCAVEQIPIAGRAPGGPLAMISPTNSDVALTRAGPGAPEGLLGVLYPTGKRNYARLFPTEGAQGAADALLAQRLGARRVFVLSDGGYGETLSFYFRRAARALGLRVGGAARWKKSATSYRDLARRVAAARPDAVFVAGLLDTNGGAVVKALRAALPAGVELIATDGFLPISRLFESAGAAAKGVLVSLGGLPNGLLGREGRTFIRDFAATQPDGAVHRQSVLAAAATATLLDAIGRSQGKRAEVVQRLLASRARRSILGPFALDANGDIVPSPITIVRARRGGGSDVVESIEGATVQRVIRPPASLLK